MDKADVVLMPYFITDKSSECSGWAVTKQNGDVIGCHKTKQSAIKQMVAVSLAEKMKPGGERALNDELEVGDFVFWENAGQTEYGLITFISTYGVVTDQLGATVIATQDRPIAKISVYELVGDRLVGTDRFVIKSFAPLTKLEMPDYEEDHNNDHEDNLVDDLDDDMRIDVKVPAYMRAAARRGLQYVSEGKAGDGLKQQTINEARKMAAGEISDDKWIRMAAWIARHLGDLDSPEADPQHPNYPSAGVVAHLLWGSGPSKTKARAAMEFAQGVVERIRKEEDRHLPGKHNQKSHGGGKSVFKRDSNSPETISQLHAFTDPSQNKVYAAETKIDNSFIDQASKPVTPRLVDFDTDQEYIDAYNKYTKDHNNWAQKQLEKIHSDLGKEQLDGSKKGVENYFDTVTESDWFIEKFGTPHPDLGKPDIVLSSAKSYSGRLELSRKGEDYFYKLRVHKSFTKNESTILHEIAHHATHMSAKGKYEGHGVDFRNAHLFIVENVIGKEYADKLRDAYKAEGLE